ncbi:MAG: four helix bundle protein [Bacteroidia bacterium]|nr:four helix bundle protein [Bacteroidia bacterium]
MKNKDFRTLVAYQKAFELAVSIHQITQGFPKEEKYSLTDQIRRSSRSVCANIAESYRKRRYVKHFVSKLTDADSEAAESIVWLDLSLRFGYINESVHSELSGNYEDIGRLLNYMMSHPAKFSSQP